VIADIDIGNLDIKGLRLVVPGALGHDSPERPAR